MNRFLDVVNIALIVTLISIIYGAVMLGVFDNFFTVSFQ